MLDAVRVPLHPIYVRQMSLQVTLQEKATIACGTHATGSLLEL